MRIYSLEEGLHRDNTQMMNVLETSDLRTSQQMCKEPRPKYSKSQAQIMDPETTLRSVGGI